MRNVPFLTVLLGGFLLLCGNPVRAVETRIATLDLQKVFHGYYKTAIIEQDFREQGNIIRNYIARQGEELKKLENEWNATLNGASNLALTAEERQKRQAQADEIEKQLKSRRVALEQYTAERTRVLESSMNDMRAKVLEEIYAEVRRRAAIDKLTLVLDSSGNSTNAAPLVLYASPVLDITDQVLTELNRGAAKPAAQPAAKPAAPAAQPAAAPQPQK